MIPPNASSHIQLAAREVRRYVYLRTGELLPIGSSAAGQNVIRLLRDGRLAPQSYRLKTEIGTANLRTLTLAGGSDLAVLYAAYHFAEKLGVRFYLHGDVVPDRKTALLLPDLDETHSPFFETRGILPFHDFTEGPDWWEADDYKAHFTQLVKMRMNFMGLHCYPEGPAGPEPLVWIGHPGDVDPSGKVSFSSPSFWNSTSSSAWGHAAMRTRDFAGGAGRLFADDDFGPSVTRGHRPLPKTPEACNEVFERTAGMLRDALRYGRWLGVRICLGTETPLHIPQSVQARLRAMGLDPREQDVRQTVYEGMFRRIARAYPIDFYWLWTPESWTWAGANQAQIDAAARDVQTAIAALKQAGSLFGFATCGWELGPKQDRTLFDRLLPKDAAMACINRNLGFNWVDLEFARIEGRPKWAIPWLEDDGAMVLPQLWVGRTRRDAADALAYGCSGVIGIHWRTKALAPNVSALAASAWSQQGWNPDAARRAKPSDAPGGDRKRDLPCADFYRDMAAVWFGPEVAAEMAQWFARHDGDGGARGVIQGRATLPRPTVWLYGPGAIVASREPWAEASKRYALVDELAALGNRVRGEGNRARFDYWLNTFRYMRALEEAACARGALDLAMERAKAEKDVSRRRAWAKSDLLPARVRLARAWETMIGHLLAATDSPGELGTIANLEQSTRVKLKFVEVHDKELAELTGGALPETTRISLRYQGEPRIIVPTVRDVVARGETPQLKVLVLDNEVPREAALLWRALGAGEFRSLALGHMARGVYKVTLPAVPDEGAEYYLRVKTAGGKDLVWPATAPELNQTLVPMNSDPNQLSDWSK